VSDAAELEGTRPLLRGVFHQAGFFASLVTGALLVAAASDGVGRVAAAVFAVSVAVMFAASALYHRVRWSPSARALMRRVDHAGIYLLIAGSYTPYGLLVLDGAWRITILGLVWTGVAVAIAIRFAFPHAPGWLTASLALSLGWISVVALPKAFAALGPVGFGLLLAGGLLYSAGGVVYVLRRPNPFPSVFGFHELFHVLVLAAVACQYASVAFFALPAA